MTPVLVRPLFRPARASERLVDRSCLGDRETAIETAAAHLLNAAQREVREASLFHHVLVVLALRAADPTAAIAAFDEACRIEPHVAEHRGMLSAAYLENRDTTRALAELEGAYAMRPITADVGTCLAFACEATGDPARALVVIDQVIMPFPEHAPALFNKAAALKALGRRDEARGLLDWLVEVAPDFAPRTRPVPASDRLAGTGDSLVVVSVG